MLYKKKQADEFIIEFGSELARLKENFMIFIKSEHDLIENCNKNEAQTVILTREMTEMRLQITSMGERRNEINHRTTELEQEHSDLPSQDPSFAEIVRTTSSASNVVFTPSSPSSVERIDKLEYTTSEVKRERRLLQVKVTLPGISTTSSEQLNMPNYEIDDQMYVAKMPQPHTVMITLSHHRFEVFLFLAKNRVAHQ